MTLSYDTALKLKEAGFPQTVSGDGYFDKTKWGEDAYHPTLDELIAACGDDFYEMGHLPTDPPQYRWYAASFDNDWVARHYGTTPSEAVANLYVALHSPTEHRA